MHILVNMNVGITSEADPQVADNMANNSVPRWDVTNLVSGNIYNNPANGRIGIGTAGPAKALEISRGENIPQLRISNNRTPTGYYMELGDNGLITYQRTIWSAGVVAQFTTAGTTWTGDPAGGFDFAPRGASALRIQGNGNVGIGTPWPAAKLDVNGHTVIRGQLYLNWSHDAIQSLHGPFLAFYSSQYYDYTTVLVPASYGFMVANAANTRPNMEVVDGYAKNGEVKSGKFTVTSDDRIKFNEQKLEYGLAEVMALESKRYDRAEWEYDQETDEIIIHPEKVRNEIGLVAQDVQRVIPEAVNIPEDENRSLWSISYDTLIPVLVKAIQEQQAQIEELKREKQTLSASGTLPDTPLTADFDGDGKTDRALVSANGDWYFWLSGSEFVKIGPYNFGVTGKPVASDFDGDGKADPGMVDANGNWYVWLSASGYSQSKL